MCDPITLGIVAVNAAATVGAGAVVNNQLNKAQDKAAKKSAANAAALTAGLPSNAPTKTQADIQDTVENARTNLNLSQLGFGANFQTSSDDTGALGLPGDYLRKALSAYKLGA